MIFFTARLLIRVGIISREGGYRWTSITYSNRNVHAHDEPLPGGCQDSLNRLTEQTD